MFAIRPVVQDSSICLRCQYRMKTKSQLRPSRRRLIRSSEKARHFVPGRNIRQESALHNDVVPTDDGIAAFDDRLGRPVIKYERISDSFRRMKMDTKKEVLSFDALGQPAEVLILRNRRRSSQQPAEIFPLHSDIDESNVQKNAEMSPAQMLKEINGERGIIDLGQACENIESMRQSELDHMEAAGRSIKATEYAKLASRLRSGFTIDQLSAYLDGAVTSESNDAKDLYDEASTPLYSRTSWTPRTESLQPSEALKDKEKAKTGVGIRKSIVEQVSGRVSHKSRLVDKILRQCWQLRPKREDSALGEMDLRLQPLHLDLVLNHKRDILKQMSQSYDAKLEALREEKIIRITSDYETCADILKLFEFTIDNIQKARFNLSHLIASKSDFAAEVRAKIGDGHIFRDIELLTNTVIRPRDHQMSWPNVAELDINYLGPDTNDLEDARRLIEQSLLSTAVRDRRLFWQGSISKEMTTPVPVDVGNGLPLAQRSRQWSRWSTAMSRHTSDLGAESGLKDQSKSTDESAASGTKSSPLSKKALRALTEFYVNPRAAKEEASNDMKRYWKPILSYSDSTMFGQVLFPAPVAKTAWDVLKRKEPKFRHGVCKRVEVRENAFRSKVGDFKPEFLPLVPGLLRALESLGPTKWGEEYLRIRLSPSLINPTPSVLLGALPDLEIRIDFNIEKQMTAVRDVRLVTRKELDILLPDHTMDLRFDRSSCVYAQIDKIDPRILQFVQASALDIWGTERLETPPGLALQIPSHAIQHHITNFDSSKLVDYSFASLEHRCELGIPMQPDDPRTKLVLTNIEAGRIGGRRSELRLVRSTKRKDDIKELTSLTEKAKRAKFEDNIEDESHSASLYPKAKALIKHIEGSKPANELGGLLLVPELARQAKQYKARNSSKYKSFRLVKADLKARLANKLPRGEENRSVAQKNAGV